MNDPKSYRAIMLSSTFTDLKEHRQRAIKAIREFGYKAEVMEESGARADVDVIDSSLKMARDSVAYALIIGRKYGQTPNSPTRNPDRLSITELEFNEAVRLKRPILLFIMDKKHSIIEDDIELDPDKRKKLDAFRERAKRMRDGEEVQRVYETFESLEQFSTAAAIAIGKLTQQLEQREADERLSEIAIAAEITAPRRTLSNIPINVPRHFLGRDEDLVAIETALKRNQGRVAITALHGLRGVGKTTLAVAYAERHSNEYRATWWIRAQNESTMRADLVGLGVQLGWVTADEKEEPALTALMERLRYEGNGILLVYDNANNAGELRPYIPLSGFVQIIVTSNAPDWRGVAAHVEIEVWSEDVGADYLIARTGRDKERVAAVALSETLGGLPLAHEQAAAYCVRLGISFADYLRRFKSNPAKLLDAQKDAPFDYGRTVATTFALAIDEATKLHPAAGSLIVYAALLAPEPIPMFLFSEAREEFGDPFASSLADEGLDEAVAALLAFALVDRETIPDERNPSTVTDCIRLHRLVLQVAAARCKGKALQKARQRLVRALAAVFPYSVYNDPTTWPRVRRLDAFVMALMSDPSRPKGSEKETAKVLRELGAYRHYSLNAFEQARRLFETTLSICEQTFGPEHQQTCVSLSYLALLFRDNGDFERARPLFERVLEIQEKIFGTEHRETATALNNLALVLRAEGDVAKARELHQRALAIRETVLGVDHPITAVSLNNLAFLLKSQGDLTGAQPLFERALAIREATFDPDHPETNIARGNLASLFLEKGNAEKALELGMVALAAHDKVLGSYHPWTNQSAHITADALDALGRSEEAKALREKYGIPE